MRIARRAVLAALAGCAGCAGGEPTPTPSPTPADYLGRFRRNLALAGHEVVRLERVDGGVAVRYRTAEATRAAVERSVRTVASAFAAVVGAGWEPGRLEATVAGPDGEPLARYRIRAAWARAFNDDRNATAYGDRIAATVTVHVGTPAHTADVSGR